MSRPTTRFSRTHSLFPYPTLFRCPGRDCYARLDAFGRIYNRVIQHAMSREQVERKLRAITVRLGDTERRLLSEAEVDIVMSGVSKPDDIILNDVEFWADRKSTRLNSSH